MTIMGLGALVLFLGSLLLAGLGRWPGPGAEEGNGVGKLQGPGPVGPPTFATKPGLGEKPQVPEKGELVVKIGDNVPLDLVLIQPGSFVMGDTLGNLNEQPAHKVTITRHFYLGKYEVTQEQWEVVMGNNPSHFRGPKNPVDSVSWEQTWRLWMVC
jgi:hypothetical protein